MKQEKKIPFGILSILILCMLFQRLLTLSNTSLQTLNYRLFESNLTVFSGVICSDLQSRKDGNMAQEVKRFLASNWLKEHNWIPGSLPCYWRRENEGLFVEVYVDGVCVIYKKEKEEVNLMVTLGYVDQAMYTIMGHCA